MNTSVRVRFAPSPTGPLHIGGLRTALYNYLFAKKHSGQFILRIEDTDQSRYVEGAEQYIKEALDWSGLTLDESPDNPGEFGPYRQSERQHIYGQYAQKLIDSGHAYYAFDTAEELDKLRKERESKGETFTYNSQNRTHLNNSLNLSEEECQKLIDGGQPYVIRFKMPMAKQLLISDIIRGNIQVRTDALDDKILFKSDGMPTYHLANIVDDHLMKITHVIRGEEWLPSLALHILLYDALGWEPPEFAHLPLILKPNGKGKLSKRDGEKHGFPVFPLEWKDPKSGQVSAGYREDYYLPEAVVNILALLGWNDTSDQEIFSLNELVEKFDLARVHKAGAKFDPEKTEWFQHQYVQRVDEETLAHQFQQWLKGQKQIDSKLDYIRHIVHILKERINFVPDFWNEGYFFFEAPKDFNSKASKKAWKNGTSEIISNLKTLISEQNDFSKDHIQPVIKNWIQSQNIGFGKVMQPLRLSLVGDMKGPDVFDIITLLGKDEVIKRLEFAQNTLK
ncbi:glutamate--tRNA ligase [Mesohalobacter halotolerans]|uniref:Glutamate--tRNA ligase n=1 Tax=Mesohalobacter halotolerans TaxID=1883405 RepID=A0A4U5TSY8_9FLAO|nr:glutamate--tRNA ligase [Mesohalobacter halotolerans]TKS57467.1 glutamate--tRNA ligase [Mesohalobacter halotolerans]